MNRNCLVALILAGLLSTAIGCSQKSAPSPAPSRAMLMAFGGHAISEQQPRFIAERHKLEVVTSQSELQESWESVLKFCGTIRCEVVSSSITVKTGASEPSGVIQLRVVPEDLAKLLADVENDGKLGQHTTEREDKTLRVIDTEARIKNLTAFRDNLRGMLGKPSASVRDLVEIQKQLTDTQAELDSEAAQRKVLANETEKVAVEISFHVASSGGAGALGQIWNALSESGSVLADSTASLITVIVAVIPWLVLIIPAFWLLRRIWKGFRRKKTQAQATGATQ